MSSSAQAPVAPLGVAIIQYTLRFNVTIPANTTPYQNLFQIPVANGRKMTFTASIWFSQGSAGQVHVKLVLGQNFQTGTPLIPFINNSATLIVTGSVADYIGDNNTCYGVTPFPVTGGQIITGVGYNSDPTIAHDVTFELQITESPL